MKLTWSQKLAILLFVVAVGAGIIQYNMGNDSESGEIAGLHENEKAAVEDFGEAVYVDGEVMDLPTIPPAGTTFDIPSEMPVNTAPPGASSTFNEIKLARDQARSKLKDEYASIASGKKNAKATKEAQSKLVKLSADEALEKKIELLLKEKGFGETMTTIAEDGSVDVVIDIEGFDQTGAAQISDTVARQASVEISEVYIKNKSK